MPIKYNQRMTLIVAINITMPVRHSEKRLYSSLLNGVFVCFNNECECRELIAGRCVFNAKIV